MRIADVGTGTGIWLSDLADALPKTCQLDGFDLSDAMFPSKDALPDNITFHHQNLLVPFPDEYLEKYDVVNVRVMVVALSSNEWEPAVRNMMTLLKPGGYLQWVDCAAHECVIKGVPEGNLPINAQRGIDLFRKTLNSLGKTANITLLRGIFQKSGLLSCEEEIYTLDNPETRESLNLSVLVGIQHILTAAFNLHKLDEIQSIDQILELKEAALRDLRDTSCYYCYDVSTSGAVEIPLLLQGLAPPVAEEENRGTMDYSKPPVAIFAGALYGDEEIDEMRQACQGLSFVPWLKMDMTVPKPPIGPGYAEHVVQRIKACMKKIEAEGMLEQDGLWLY
ncbi:uncharacterized protein N7484_001544 [Penicillium longicatenatum]|uniref:uncharacterized protein n=1 Tax=Penicillium longicatenatum TaxID=1561947 RepID=UPI0025474126|nr:uncharacterized protein N7484_001544 [Penicillium longicatenatum]KAJ5657895.1 hypothetical protein N7484_001544 [Penicillium longicatenatum]